MAYREVISRRFLLDQVDENFIEKTVFRGRRGWMRRVFYFFVHGFDKIERVNAIQLSDLQSYLFHDENFTELTQSYAAEEGLTYDDYHTLQLGEQVDMLRYGDIVKDLSQKDFLIKSQTKTDDVEFARVLALAYAEQHDKKLGDFDWSQVQLSQIREDKSQNRYLVTLNVRAFNMKSPLQEKVETIHLIAEKGEKDTSYSYQPLSSLYVDGETSEVDRIVVKDGHFEDKELDEGQDKKTLYQEATPQDIVYDKVLGLTEGIVDGFLGEFGKKQEDYTPEELRQIWNGLIDIQREILSVSEAVGLDVTQRQKLSEQIQERLWQGEEAWVEQSLSGQLTRFLVKRRMLNKKWDLQRDGAQAFKDAMVRRSTFRMLNEVGLVRAKRSLLWWPTFYKPFQRHVSLSDRFDLIPEDVYVAMTSHFSEKTYVVKDDVEAAMELLKEKVIENRYSWRKTLWQRVKVFFKRALLLFITDKWVKGDPAIQFVTEALEDKEIFSDGSLKDQYLWDTGLSRRNKESFKSKASLLYGVSEIPGLYHRKAEMDFSKMDLSALLSGGGMPKNETLLYLDEVLTHLGIEESELEQERERLAERLWDEKKAREKGLLSHKGRIVIEESHLAGLARYILETPSITDDMIESRPQIKIFLSNYVRHTLETLDKQADGTHKKGVRQFKDMRRVRSAANFADLMQKTHAELLEERLQLPPDPKDKDKDKDKTGEDDEDEEEEDADEKAKERADKEAKEKLLKKKRERVKELEEELKRFHEELKTHYVDTLEMGVTQDIFGEYLEQESDTWGERTKSKDVLWTAVLDHYNQNKPADAEVWDKSEDERDEVFELLGHKQGDDVDYTLYGELDDSMEDEINDIVNDQEKAKVARTVLEKEGKEFTEKEDLATKGLKKKVFSDYGYISAEAGAALDKGDGESFFEDDTFFTDENKEAIIKKLKQLWQSQKLSQVASC